jgi:hypothetical protein
MERSPIPKNVGKALSRVHAICEKNGGSHILHTSEISREDREILQHQAWIQDIIPGWYLLLRPDVRPGDSTAWYGSFWDFTASYLNHHHKNEYCLSADQSLLFHTGSSAIPQQVIVMAKKGSGKPTKLPFDTSLLVYSDPNNLPVEKESIKDLQIMPLAYALCKLSPTFFKKNPHEVQIALQSISDPSDLIEVITEHGFTRASSRIIGAYRKLGNKPMADQLKEGLLNEGILVKEQNPFDEESTILVGQVFRSPYAARIRAMWEMYRNDVIENFPQLPKNMPNSKDYLKNIDEIYVRDAYHSLSIEGYKVSKELVHRVQDEQWNPDKNSNDMEARNALAARGYYEAFIQVRESIAKNMNEENPGAVIKEDLSLWFRGLFGPSARAKIFPSRDLYGFRRHQVFIRGSRHTPPGKEHLIDAMEELYNCLLSEKNAAVRAVLGHFIFVFIHPYMDGNGRIARFLMNAMLASGGYPWALIRVENRNEYFASLESTSVKGNIIPFCTFIAKEMKSTYTDRT